MGAVFSVNLCALCASVVNSSPMTPRILAVALLLIPLPLRAAEPLRLNQVQVVGTHNSYHVAPAPAVMQLIASAGKARAESLDYTHRPLPEQFDRLGTVLLLSQQRPRPRRESSRRA